MEYIYHGTYIGAAVSIQRDGKMRLFTEPYISFTSDYKVARYYSILKGNNYRSVILRTPLTDDFVLSPKYEKNKGHEWITTKNIPIEDIEVETKDGWIPLRKYDFFEKKVIEKMKYISRFNELVETKILSNDRVDEILKDIETISSELDKDLNKIKSYINELEEFTSKSIKSNTQIDDSYLAFKDINSKLEETISLMVDINEKLESYKKEGEKFLN